MTDRLSEDLDALSTEELRQRAFGLAERRRDVRFFWDLAKHLPASDDTATDDSFSGPGTTIADFLELWRELRGKNVVREDDPLLRAHFIDYLTRAAD
jgi:hypothetical protein